jgi:HK97 family phage portal protein
MKLGERLKTIFDPTQWSDKAFIEHEKKFFTNEPINAPIYSLRSPDEFISSGDYRGLIGSAIYGESSSRNFLNLFDCVPEIFAPIHAIASRIANADFQLRKYRNDQVVYDNEDWNRLFNTPNPLQHFRELIYEAVVYELVTGNEYMYFNTPTTLAKGYQNVMAIWNLPADQIKPIHNSSLKLFTATTVEDIVNSYKLDDKNFFEPKDVLHIKSINLNWADRKIKGRSPLLSADKAIANLIAVYEARNVIYTKRGALGAIVSRKSDESGLIPLPKGAKDALRADINSTYGLTGGRDTYSVTDQPVDFIRFGMSITDLQPFDETVADAAAIYGALNVPFELAPKVKGETFANQMTAERSMYENTIIPKTNMYMQSLTNKLGLNEAKLYLYASFDHVTALQENKKEKADTEKVRGDIFFQRFKSGVSTINDWIIDTGGEKDPNPICDKKIFDLTEEEISKLLAAFRVTQAQSSQGTPVDNGGQTNGTTTDTTNNNG